MEVKRFRYLRVFETSQAFYFAKFAHDISIFPTSKTFLACCYHNSNNLTVRQTKEFCLVKNHSRSEDAEKEEKMLMLETKEPGH